MLVKLKVQCGNVPGIKNNVLNSMLIVQKSFTSLNNTSQTHIIYLIYSRNNVWYGSVFGDLVIIISSAQRLILFRVASCIKKYHDNVKTVIIWILSNVSYMWKK